MFVHLDKIRATFGDSQSCSLNIYKNGKGCEASASCFASEIVVSFKFHFLPIIVFIIKFPIASKCLITILRSQLLHKNTHIFD